MALCIPIAEEDAVPHREGPRVVLPGVEGVRLRTVERRRLQDIRWGGHLERRLGILDPHEEHACHGTEDPPPGHGLLRHTKLALLLPHAEALGHRTKRPAGEGGPGHTQRFNKSRPLLMPRAPSPSDACGGEAPNGSVQHAGLALHLNGLSKFDPGTQPLMAPNAGIREHVLAPLLPEGQCLLPPAAHAAPQHLNGLLIVESPEPVRKGRAHHRRHAPIVEGAAQR